MNAITPETKRTTALQIRGMERRERLVAAATTLFGQHPIEDVTLTLLAQRAGIPIGSTYHFYPKFNELFATMVGAWHAEPHSLLSQPYIGDASASSQAIVDTSIKRVTTFYNQRPDGRQLILSDKSSPDIKHADRSYDQAIGQLMIKLFRKNFELPDFRGRVDVLYGVKIDDLFFMLSNIRHGTIAEEFFTETQRALVNCLRNYLSQHLSAVVAENHPHSTH